MGDKKISSRMMEGTEGTEGTEVEAVVAAAVVEAGMVVVVVVVVGLEDYLRRTGFALVRGVETASRC